MTTPDHIGKYEDLQLVGRSLDAAANMNSGLTYGSLGQCAKADAVFEKACE